jgi:alkanesulfonate monooxygenase SsuD/methylene tetrahydromethanopterin reductase-like flavin-dependent oxidoreductase (luciferase family)
MIRPWIFEFFSAFQRLDAGAFDPAGCAADFAWYLDQWTRAEAAGFEGIFFSEHHFVPGRFSPSPNLLIAAVAARTRTLRLGAMGNVVPLYEPWRLAEEYAMLDQLSGGRLEIGLASGSGPREHLKVGISAEEVRARFDEALDVIDAALTLPVFSHHGRFWNFEHLSVVPRPLQQPTPPRWMTGISPLAAQAAARRGYRFCTGFLSSEQAAALAGEHRAAVRAAGGQPHSEQFALRRMVVLADDDGAGRALGGAALARLRAVMKGPPPSAHAAAAAAAGDVADAPRARQGGPTVADEECIAGSPRSVAQEIIEQCRRSGAGHFLAYTPNTLSRDEATHSFALWPEVIRSLRSAPESP